MTCKERLTIEYDGNFVPKACCTVNRYGEADDCSSCDEICEEIVRNYNGKDIACNDCPIQKCFNKLAELENKFENGTLSELPCKVGDTVYVLDYENDNAVDYSGYIFIMANNDFAFLSPVLNGESNPIEICNEYFQQSIDDEDNSGVIVPLTELFLTKFEAEQKLKELLGDN